MSLSLTPGSVALRKRVQQCRFVGNAVLEIVDDLAGKLFPLVPVFKGETALFAKVIKHPLENVEVRGPQYAAELCHHAFLPSDGRKLDLLFQASACLGRVRTTTPFYTLRGRLGDVRLVVGRSTFLYAASTNRAALPGSQTMAARPNWRSARSQCHLVGMMVQSGKM
ncbi:hypothetical protein MPLB_1870017 [Mesorhizobium sp. ORS 3324]|nr:hypothetical protein MPLB_1870017 [Mesorhizobium sp. ORS 3324]